MHDGQTILSLWKTALLLQPVSLHCLIVEIDYMLACRWTIEKPPPPTHWTCPSAKKHNYRQTSLSHSLSLLLCHTHTHTHTHTLSLSLLLSHTHSLSLTLLLSHTHTLSLSLLGVLSKAGPHTRAFLSSSPSLSIFSLLHHYVNRSVTFHRQTDHRQTNKQPTDRTKHLKRSRTPGVIVNTFFFCINPPPPQSKTTKKGFREEEKIAFNNIPPLLSKVIGGNWGKMGKNGEKEGKSGK